VSLTQTEQRICDLAQQMVVQQAKIDDANKALSNAKLTPDANSIFAELLKIRAAQTKIDTIKAEFDTLSSAYAQERVNHPALSKVLFAGSKAA
jgi:hypothetical protein